MRTKMLTAMRAQAFLLLGALLTVTGCDPSKRMSDAASEEAAAEDAPSFDFLKNATEIPGQLKKKSGCNPCRALKIHVSKTHVTAELQDSRDPLKADAWQLGGHVPKGSEPVMFLGSTPTIEVMNASTFDLERDVDWSKVAGLVDRATELARLDEIQSVSLTLSRGTGGYRPAGREGKLEFGVGVRGLRGYAHIEFDASGNVIPAASSQVAPGGDGGPAPNPARPACTCKPTDALCDCL